MRRGEDTYFISYRHGSNDQSPEAQLYDQEVVEARWWVGRGTGGANTTALALPPWLVAARPRVEAALPSHT